jgi:hypothetical protein
MEYPQSKLVIKMDGELLSPDDELLHWLPSEYVLQTMIEGYLD